MLHVAGPAESLHVRQERLNRINAGDNGTTPDPILVDRNPRYYDLYSSINAARLSSVELNKVWRRKEFHNGGVLEPFIGARFMTFKDLYRQDGYGRFDLDPQDFPDLNSPNPLGPSADAGGASPPRASAPARRRPAPRIVHPNLIAIAPRRRPAPPR